MACPSMEEEDLQPIIWRGFFWGGGGRRQEGGEKWVAWQANLWMESRPFFPDKNGGPPVANVPTVEPA